MKNFMSWIILHKYIFPHPKQINSMPTLNEIYWESRYNNGETGWDIGSASPAISNYAAQYADKSIKVMIPGCGNAHEAGALLNLGYTDVTLLDIAASPLAAAKEKYNAAVEMGHLKLVQDDFFNHQETYDLILEQTFFCAIHPSQRDDYAEKMHYLLNNNGKLAGLLFDFPLTEEGPPFGGGVAAYLAHFEPWFKPKTLEKCYNSIKPREGRELFFILEKQKA
jgi:thiopurine S-methyltransferase